MATTRIIDGDTTFALGMNSLFDPAQLDPGFYAQSMNTLNRGGVVQCRPGYRCLFAMPPGKIQAAVLFHPRESSEQIVFVVDGFIYVSDLPFTTYRLLPNVLLSDTADRVHWVIAEKSTQRNPDGSISFISPQSVLILQDGVSPPVYWDGSDSAHLRNSNPNVNTLTPIGGPMAWVGDRLWVARGSKVFASDIADPFSFTDDTYLGGSPYFLLAEDVTAMAITPSLEFQQLLVFTDNSTNLFQANIRARSTWETTPDFQREILPNVGCRASKSVTAHYGLLWWFSQFGLTSFDAASLSATTSRLPYTDNEMSVSKGVMRGDLSGIVTASFENYLLVSVPYGDVYNRHTWVLDNSIADTLSGRAPVAWNTYWTGTRPVEWLNGRVQNVERSFYASTDYDGVNRIWEAFLPDRRDEGCPITWTLETRGLFANMPLQDKEFRYADVFLTELEGDVDVAVFWAGANRGAYKKISSKRIRALRGSIRWDQDISWDRDIFALKKQSRRIRTEDVRELVRDSHDSCGVEYDRTENLDDAFQLFIVGSGPGAVRGIRAFFDPVVDNLSGRCEKDESEYNAVRYDGVSVEGDDVFEVLSELEIGPEVFWSHQTVADSIKGVSAVNSGEAKSVISQQDADKIASCIARARVDRELESTVPPVMGGVEESCL